ncbi:contactin-associated protein-like 2 isoform X2 [Xenia sp. Carnegie-2017]|uniref:contactin-associated protein-like 2 isoform X2 n=1 Tax=Xenia sp. Carnegie-2017 TaxID=2897299 RepID=UPI001F04C586|nr:contactin-associated protein-like 2 isoform X2 [Xenia sp. Carnegie-2017]
MLFLYTLLTLFSYQVSTVACSEMNVNGRSFLRFDLLGTNTSIAGATDTLSLRFRTIEPHGLLFYAHGVGYVSLELYNCKLRYTINMGQEFMFIFGDKLCDNQWHSVVITRDVQKLRVRLDKEAPRLVPIKMAKRFNAQRILRIDIRIYVGGTQKKTNEMKKTKLVGGFVGCIADALFNTYNVISEARSKRRGFTAIGDVSFRCKPTVYFEPFGFNNDRGFLKFPTGNPNSFSVQLRFRTYDENGILIHREGSKISVWVYLQNGKLKIDFYIPKTPLFSISTDSWMHNVNFNDGEWHAVTASVNLTKITFRVDNEAPSVTSVHVNKYVNSLKFENVTYVGGGIYYKKMFGFVGCLKDLKVNGIAIQARKLSKDVKVANVQLGTCGMQSLCHPSSCEHKSRCEQISNNFTCHCKRFFRGRFCETPLFQRTCQGYKKLGMKQDAYCTIDPDGKGDLAEFKVLCNMTGDTEAVTVVNHTRSMRPIQIRDEAYRYSYAMKSWAHKLDYGGVDLANVRAMVEESRYCRQYVKFNCINTKFLTPRDRNLPGAYWVSHDGMEHRYWGGSTKGAACACGSTKSCHNPAKMCNCETGDGVWRQDAGYLTNKDHLPVAALFFPLSAGSSNFTVGPLECFGRKKTRARAIEKEKFFGVACQPLVTTRPPLFPWQKITSTVKPTRPQAPTTQK